MKNHKNHYTTALVLMAAFVVFTLLLLIVDIQAIGPLGTKVGFGALNGFVARTFPENPTWDMIAKVTGILLLLVAAFFAFLGAKQLWERRSITRVDHDILALGAVYAADLVLYVIFEKLVINYRPVLEDGELAASYPSSRTVLVFSVFGMAIAGRFGSIFGSRGLRTAACWISGILIVAMIATRLMSGVHWVTDIIGSVFLSNGLFLLYAAMVNRADQKKTATVPWGKNYGIS